MGHEGTRTHSVPLRFEGSVSSVHFYTFNLSFWEERPIPRHHHAPTHKTQGNPKVHYRVSMSIGFAASVRLPDTWLAVS